MNHITTHFHIFRTSTQLFLAKGFEQVSMNDVAGVAGVSADEVYKYFGNKEDIIFYLYRIINNDWEAEVTMLHQEKLHARFQAAMLVKMQLIAPYKGLLKNLLPLLLNDDDLGVFSQANKVTRVQGMAIVDNIVSGSKGVILKGSKKAELARALYLMHWSVLFLSLHETNNTKSVKLLDTFAAWLKELTLTKQMLLPLVLPRISEVSDIVMDEEGGQATLAMAVLDVLFNKRKLLPGSTCEKKYCSHCYSLHIGRVQHFVDRGEPVHIILPAFPAKSPNLDKVLGKLPDLSEEIALLSLQGLCDDIARVYKPGAHITICADGRIFADLVQVPDADITAYAAELRNMIARLELKNIDIVNLEDLLTDMSFDEARAYVIAHYAEDMDALREKIKMNEQYKTLFNGMHRFISDDRMYTEPGKSKSKIKEEAKDVAIGVIQRSNAWTKFLRHFYPNAVRLSIHPQGPHSEKIGIKQTKAADEWITPWHGVIVLKKDNYILMKKQDAEEMQATLVYKHGRPSHYTINPK